MAVKLQTCSPQNGLAKFPGRRGVSATAPAGKGAMTRALATPISRFIEMLKAFGVFVIGFVARPIGGAMFGHYGDRIGRKAILIVTLLMTVSPPLRSGWFPAKT